ncbi:hypothetical protein F5B20DRAFT_545865 [Whalleya microplaca]|nr:hypothetical protein F5B20DRAFT_545865 [Whalleya microplaca]
MEYPFIHPQAIIANEWYHHNEPETMWKDDIVPKGYVINAPRDHSVPRTSYERVSLLPNFPYHESQYDQPFGYPSTGGYGTSSRRPSRHLPHGSYRQVPLKTTERSNSRASFGQSKDNDQLRHRGHQSLQAEWSPDDSLAPRKPQGSQRKHVHFQDEIAHDEISIRERVAVGKNRKIYPNADSHYDAAASRTPRAHTGKRPIASLPYASDMGEGKQHRSLKGAYHVPVPPKAPKIPRLPSPDFNVLASDKHDMSGYQFCACCHPDMRHTEDGHPGSSQDKMDRQCQSS